MNWKIILSLILCYIGSILTGIAYQITIEPTPEWCFDLQSLGIFIFMSSPFFLIWGLSNSFEGNFINWFRIPAIQVSFTTGFDFVKEAFGLNNDHSTEQVIFYCIGLTIFTIYQYAIIERSSN